MQVLIGDQSAFMCRLVRECLPAECEIVAEVASGLELVETHAETNPDCVVLDIDLAIIDGIEATNRIADQDPDTHIVVCVTDSDSIPQVRKTGADEVIIKPFEKTALECAITPE